MESSLTRGISSRTICDFLNFYMYFVFVVAGLNVVNMIYLSYMMKGVPVAARLLSILFFAGFISILIMLGISLYVVCERGLKPNIEAEEDKYRRMASSMNSGTY